VKFWDSSAVIPLCCKEPESGVIQELAKADSDMVVWWATRTKCVSAVSRRLREGSIRSGMELKAKAILSALSSAWSEVQPTDLVRLRTERLLMVHPLRAADAFQLAAALTWAQESPVGLDVVCLDQALRLAAAKEGFTVLP
jgi:predicted nucleic acid-binding protein